MQYVTFHGSQTQFMEGFMVGHIYTGNTKFDNELLVRVGGVLDLDI